jgi:hypothetical protein
LSRDYRRIVGSDWYRWSFPTRLSPQRQAVPEFETTAQGCRIATSVGGVLTGRGGDIIIIDDPLKPEEALSEAHRAGRQRMVRPHALQPAQRQAAGSDCANHAPAARGRSGRACAGAGGLKDRPPAGDRRGRRDDRRRQPIGAALFRTAARRGIAPGARAAANARADPQDDRRIINSISVTSVRHDDRTDSGGCLWPRRSNTRSS